MATESVTATNTNQTDDQADETPRSVRIPSALKTSENCIAIPAGNDHTFHNGVALKRGEVLVFDLDRRPKLGDIVLMKWKGRAPFARECSNPPIGDRDQWSMGTMDHETGDLTFFDIATAEWVGVLIGKVPAEARA